MSTLRLLKTHISLYYYLIEIVETNPLKDRCDTGQFLTTCINLWQLMCSLVYLLFHVTREK